MTELPRNLQDFIDEHGMPSGSTFEYASTPTEEPEPEEAEELSAEQAARVDLLAKAAFAASEDPEGKFGTNIDSLTRTGAMWAAYLGIGEPLHPADVAVLLLLAETVKLSFEPTGYDYWVNIAGYAAAGGAVFGEQP